VIEALSDIVYYFDTKYNAEIESRELSAESEKILSDYWDVASKKIRKMADCGAFLFSNEANDALAIFISECKKTHNSYFEQLDSDLFEANKCLTSLVSLSKIDLKLS